MTRICFSEVVTRVAQEQRGVAHALVRPWSTGLARTGSPACQDHLK